jgi:hypothetical protein
MLDARISGSDALPFSVRSFFVTLLLPAAWVSHLPETLDGSAQAGASGFRCDVFDRCGRGVPGSEVVIQGLEILSNSGGACQISRVGMRLLLLSMLEELVPDGAGKRQHLACKTSPKTNPRTACKSSLWERM